MGDRLKFERFLWFHERVKATGYPNAAHLSEKFEISPRTAQRDIEFMRDRMFAPLLYSSDPVLSGKNRTVADVMWLLHYIAWLRGGTTYTYPWQIQLSAECRQFISTN